MSLTNRKPNVIYIYADDLGRGLLSCYGQKEFTTPHIDRLADEGMKFEYAYGAAFCAPARASLLCGIHDAHAGEWTFTRAGVYKEVSRGAMTVDEVFELIQNTGLLPKPNALFLPKVFKQAGYATGQIGKLEWGFSTTAQELFDHGWDYHYGYYDHERCHGYYPPFLFDNGLKTDIPGNTDLNCGKGRFVEGTEIIDHNPEGRAVYSQDLFDDKIISFIRENKDRPFFLFHPSQLPHAPVFAPEVYKELQDNPKLNDVEREFASMVKRLDVTVGKILDELDRLGLTDNTMVLFSSDNGYTVNHQTKNGVSDLHTADGRVIDNIDVKFQSKLCNDVFDADTGLSGVKFTTWQGGVAIPFMVRWPGVVAPGTVSNHRITGYDMMATMADLFGIDLPADKDGLSYLPVLEGRPEQASVHDVIPFASTMGPAIIDRDGWKLRVIVDWDRYRYSHIGGDDRLKDAFIYQLYDTNQDSYEDHNVADQYPQKVLELRTKLMKECGGNLAHGTPQMHFAFFGNDWYQFHK